MRDIEFRGLYLDYHLYEGQDKWIYGFLGKDIDEDKYYIQSTKDNDSFGEGYLVEEKTIGQYTGLKDKKGRKIYEGDILKNSQGYLEKVIFINGSFRVTSITFPNINIYLLSSYGGCIEVIGNIYKNPGLLEAK